MNNKNQLQAYILCGGKSSRMKSEKGLVNFSGKPFIYHIIEALKPITNNLVLVTTKKEYEKFGFPLLEDVYNDKGPVGGIFTALNHSKVAGNLILSCDIPLITTEVIQKLIDAHTGSSFSISIATGLNQRHPLIGMYNKTLESFFENQVLKNELKLMDVVQKLAHQTVFIDNLEALRNINSKEELDSLSKPEIV